MSPSSVRFATASDVPAIRRIVRDAYSPYIPRIGREPGPMTDDYAALVDQRRVQVLDRDGIVEGLLVLIPEIDTLLLDNVAIAPSAQGSGLGRTLLATAERVALEMGYGSIRLYTHEAMTENLAIYERHGYVETHRAEERGLRRVFLSKPLKGDGLV